MYDTILVPTDGSDHAIHAAEHALGLAEAFGAEVDAITVVDVRRAAGPFDAGGVDEAFVERLEAEAEAAIEDVEAAASGPRADHLDTAVLRGHPREAILEYASDRDADLLAMGTHGRTGIDRYVAGSVTEHVVRRAGMPVLAVRATERSPDAEGYDDVLVPTDGSESAAVAVRHALEIANAFDARVHALNVVDVGGVAGGPEFAIPPDVLEDAEAAGERATSEIADEAEDAGLSATTEVRRGAPAREVLDYVEAVDVDLVAMGTAGRTGPSRFLLGSTTERVVRHAEVPVLAVDARDSEG